MFGNDNFSDTETYSSRLRRKNDLMDGKKLRRHLVGDEESAPIEHSSSSADEFAAGINIATKSLLSGRQRKKQAARTKGGEFQAMRKKRRIYFCCVSSSIDIQKLHDYFAGTSGAYSRWSIKLYHEALHLYYNGSDDQTSSYFEDQYSSSLKPPTLMRSQSDSQAIGEEDLHCRISSSKAQEVFIFEFGAIVFWGFNFREETNLMKTIRIFVTRGLVGPTEFQEAEDDLAFLTSPFEDRLKVANDYIILPEESPPKQRMSISFALAQSSVLAVFEARTQDKLEIYKEIPEKLEESGKVDISELELGKMVGEVFVIRNDVNLHTEILDTPDFFWKQEKFENDYKLVYNYLEMSERTDVLNKRLDLMRDLPY